MNEYKKYQRYMSFKSYFKNIPLVSNLIRFVKWKYYRPYYSKKWSNKRKCELQDKLHGVKSWTDNDKRLLSLKDKYKGQTAFIIGNGPSLRLEDLEMLRLKNIFCFGTNRINLIFDKTSWRPNCYMAYDPAICKDNTLRDVMTSNIELCVLGDLTYSAVPDTMEANNLLFFYNQPNSYYEPVKEFSENAIEYLVDGFTITYAAIQFAVFLGFERICLLGVDCNYPKVLLANGKTKTNEDSSTASYFDKRYDPKNHNSGFIEGMLSGYYYAANYSKNKTFRILNATRGGKLDMFERIDFDSFIKSL